MRGEFSMGHMCICSLVLQKRWSFTRVVSQKRYTTVLTEVLTKQVPLYMGILVYHT